MEIVKENIEKVMSEAGYVYKEKYPDSQLNLLYNYWYFLQEHEKELVVTKNMPLGTIIYSKYYWFSRLAERFFEVFGFDAGIEQQYKIIEEMDQRIANVDWNFVERLDCRKRMIMQLCRKVTTYIQESDYVSLARDNALCRVSEQDIRRVLGEYGGSLTTIPDEAFHSDAYHVIPYKDGTGYHVDLDLWIDGHRSDLTLQVEVNVDENREICGYRILDLLVM